MLIPHWDKFAFCADSHGDMADMSATRPFFKHLASWKPKYRIHGGDAFDFRPLRKKASAEEQREHLGPDISCGKLFLAEMRPTHYLFGNHESRLVRIACDGDGAIGELAQMGLDDINRTCSAIGTKVLPYDKRAGILQIGQLAFLHGFFVGETAAKRHALVYGPCLFGHVHSIAEAPVPGLTRRVSRAVGALCYLDQDYNAQTPSSLQHAHGWAFGVIHKKTGDFKVWQAEKVGNEWLIPSDIERL